MTRARRLRGACVGYTFGVFDLFNVEHLDLLRQAATHCDELVVAVADDDLVRRSGGPVPFTPHDERMAIVGSVRGVGRVVPLDTWDLAAAAREVGAEVLLTVTNGDAVQRAADPAAETAGIRVHRLIPRRRSASRTVRGALGPSGRNAVA
ncbi:MAG TPA: adenylyltransferase/cytidyltransferase family protein [Kineosporiaceae bacterium]|nr:adenylyltransferase/cytidyltransferase family protein [Kineosporiaceae bacterium]